MTLRFMFANAVPVDLVNPTHHARSLVRHLAEPGSSNKSLKGIMSALLSFMPNMHRPPEILLAVEAVGRFIDSAPGILEAMLIDNIPQIAPVLFPGMLTALRISWNCLTIIRGFNPVDATVIYALNALLRHESALKHFAQSDSLTDDIDIIIRFRMLISISAATILHPSAPDLANIIETLFDYVPTRQALTYVVGKTERYSFCEGLVRLVITSGLLPNPKFSPPDSLPTNMCGLAALGRVRPSLRRLFIKHAALEALCNILRRFVIQDIDDTRAQIQEGLVEPAYLNVLAVCNELEGLLRNEVSSTVAIERVLRAGILDIIVHAVLIFGPLPGRNCGPMPAIIQYIFDWCLRSRRIAIRVHGLLGELQSDAQLWKSLPNVSPENSGLTLAFHEFLDKFERKVVVLSPEHKKEKILISCMNSKCADKLCASKRYQRCARCKVFVVCSRACFKAAYKAGEHPRAECKKAVAGR